VEMNYELRLQYKCSMWGDFGLPPRRS
jgi:hypothetical protein